MKDMYIIELPDKTDTYTGKMVEGGKLVDNILNTREEYLNVMKGMMSKHASEVKKTEDMVSIMNFFTLVKELDENEKYIEVDLDDINNLKDGFEKMKPEERPIGAFQNLPNLFSQLCSPKKLEA